MHGRLSQSYRHVCSFKTKHPNTQNKDRGGQWESNNCRGFEPKDKEHMKPSYIIFLSISWKLLKF